MKWEEHYGQVTQEKSWYNSCKGDNFVKLTQ